MEDYYLKRQALTIFVRGAYDLQKIRIMLGNRIAGQFRAKLGQRPGTKEQDIEDKEAKKVLKILNKEYDRITDGVVDSLVTVKTFKGQELISSHTEWILVHEYRELLRREEEHFSRLKTLLKEFPLWTEYLKPEAGGVGPAMAGVIISEIDIRKAKYVSSIWKWCGLDLGPDGRGRGRYKEHQVDREYIDKNGQKQMKKSITFSPFIKTKLIGVLGPSFIKIKNGKYRKIYDERRHRITNTPRFADISKGHAHNKAIRYIIKQFLADLYDVWKDIEGLPKMPRFSEAKLGLHHAHKV